jgi:hypothetical protein
MWNARHLNLKRYSDLLLHFFGRSTGPLRNDLDVVIGNVRVSLYRQVME